MRGQFSGVSVHRCIAIVAAAILIADTVSTPLLARADAATYGSQGGVTLGYVRELSSADQDIYLDKAKATGAKWARFEIRYENVQAEGFSSFDSVVEKADARGLKIIGQLNNSKVLDATTFSNFAKSTAAHFVKTKKINYWEIWNEPNGNWGWGGHADPHAYAAMMVASYSAIKSVNKKATVLAGAMGPTLTSPAGCDVASGACTSYRPPDFLNELYKNPDFHTHFDALSLHISTDSYWPFDCKVLQAPTPAACPTGDQSWSPLFQTGQLNATMTSYGDGAKKIWSTESRDPSTSSHSWVNETYQAQYIPAFYAAVRSRSYIGPVVFYSLHDENADPHVGLQKCTTQVSDPDSCTTWVDKPSYAAFTSVMKSKNG